MNKISELDDEWKAFIAAHLKWVNGWINPESQRSYKKPLDRCDLLQEIIDSKEIGIEETVKLQCLGTYFGQAIIDHTGWDWKVYEDEYGSDLAIQVPHKRAWIFPVTIISKRIEDGEEVNVLELFQGVIPLALDVEADKTSNT